MESNTGVEPEKPVSRKARFGKENNNWRGGRTIASNGYALVRKPGHPNADVRGYVYEHRYVASQILGRELWDHEIVHHIDGNKLNNSPENLQVVDSYRNHQYSHRPKDSKLRRPDENNPFIRCACGCGTIFAKFDESGRPRKFVSGHNLHPGVVNGK